MKVPKNHIFVHIEVIAQQISGSVEESAVNVKPALRQVQSPVFSDWFY